ncbi:Serine/threonine-protein kinase 16 [Irineochytrium annulatum]|nr:Serine/threonine-protein kinase 16 [Irineochytrium annulatum]
MEPIGSSRNAITTKVWDLLTIILAFLGGLVAIFKPAPTVRLGARTFKVLKSLGEGGFSFVYLVKEVTPGRASTTPHALKRVRIQLPEQEQRARDEIAAHSAVNSPHVLKLLDSNVVKNPGADWEALLLLPYYGGGTVQDLIDKTPREACVDLRTILSIAVDAARGLQAFHSKNPPLAFRDLKPANILLDDSGRAVLMDLGSVAPARVNISNRREALALQELCAETVTAPYRAPELFEPSTGMMVDERSDVWSLGCCIYAMAYGESPSASGWRIANMRTPTVDGSATAAVGGAVRFPQGKDPYGPPLRKLITTMLSTNAQARPSVVECIQAMENLLGSLGGV